LNAKCRWQETFARHCTCQSLRDVTLANYLARIEI